MEYTSSTYEGGEKFGRFDGEGVFVFPDGARYVGGFKDGQFHGKGAIEFKLGVYQGEWENGKEKSGKFTFSDGLAYSPDWQYCTGSDRRFHSETLKSGDGIRPAGELQYTNDKKNIVIPFGCYDAGDGIFDPEKGAVFQYDDRSRTLRIPDEGERNLIINKAAMRG